jgi:hypothetical protein
MKSKTQVGLVSMAIIAALGMAVSTALAKACYDSHKTVGPDVQDPGCGNAAQNGGEDNGCLQVTCSPSYDLYYVSTTRTGLTYTGAGPGTVTVTFTYNTLSCSGMFDDPPYYCGSPVIKSTVNTIPIYEPTHFIGC